MWYFNTIGMVLKIPIQQYSRCPDFFFKLQSQKIKIKICGRLATLDQGGQRNRNGKTIVFLFRTIF